MAKTYFKATHSNGKTHLRATDSGRPYAFAKVPNTLARGASFSSKRPGSLDQYDLRAGCEIVPAIEISKEEHSKIDKANRNFCQVVFRGKKYTSSDFIDQDRATHAVCLHHDDVEWREDLTPQHHKSWHEKHPEGFVIHKVRANTNVWFGSKKYCEDIRASWTTPEAKSRPHAYKVVKVIEVTQL